MLNQSKGFYLLKNFYTLEEIVWFRKMCQDFIQNGSIIHKRINSNNISDYIHPRSKDNKKRTNRIYQFFHNHKKDSIGRFLQQAISLRDEIESIWLENSIYKTEKYRYQNYNIVTQYLENAGTLPLHRDYTGPSPFPLIQFWVALSDPEVDYKQGNLILISKDGTKRLVESELQIKMGDALIFDKSLKHGVEITKPGKEREWGRWTILIGARAEIQNPIQSIIERVLYSDSIFPITQSCNSKIRRSKLLFKKFIVVS